MTPPTLLTEWARLLVGSLRRAGVRRVVVSPGSRSTPFTWAALQEPGLFCRSVIDERSAAFVALGHARITGEPTLLICTSGTAGAHYFPAVVEAAESHLPLLVLTADRPLELQQAAAPQTIDQVKLYGDRVRAFFELGTPEASAQALRALARIASQAVDAALSPVPGPVHLNARARKPLEPRSGEDAAERELAGLVDRLLERVPRVRRPRPGSAADPGLRAAIEPVADALSGARRGLIVCGPAPAPGAADPAAVARLAERARAPVFAESGSQLRFADLGEARRIDHLPALLELPGFREAFVPDVVVHLGRPPTASAWNAALEAWEGTERHVLAAHGWPDPWSTARTLTRGPLTELVEALADALEPRSEAGSEWAEALRAADEAAREVLTRSDGGFSEAAAVRAVLESIEPGDVLVLGNSLPVREADLFVPPAAVAQGVTVCTQRGANGIDGLVSGAAGSAEASGRPTTLLLGDVSLAHDLAALGLLRGPGVRLTVVVLNNRGGRIFERLPLARTLKGRDELDHWLTPPDVVFEGVTRAFGADYRCATDVGSTRRGMSVLRDTGGVLEIRIPVGGTTFHQDALRAELAERITTLPGG